MSDIQPSQTNDSDMPEALISPEDIRSTSRSCLAIIVILALIVVLLCVFVVVETWIL